MTTVKNDDRRPASASHGGEWRRRLAHEWLPVEGGEVGFLILFGAVATHVWVAVLGPDPSGHLFRAGAWVEAFAQGALLSAPFVAVYAAWRSLSRERSSVWPYLTLLGGGSLSGLTLAALLVSLVS
jgi:hypothetical protein